MYNPLDVSRIDRQIEDLQRLKSNYQNIGMPQQPINNIINTNTNKPIFEARFTNDNAADIIVQNKTAFINLKNNILTVKEVDGEMKEYQIIPPKDEKDIRIQQLENEIKTLKDSFINLQTQQMQLPKQPVNNIQQPINPVTQPNTQQTTNTMNYEPVSQETINPITNTNPTQQSTDLQVVNLDESQYTVTPGPQTLTDKLSSKFKFKK